MKLMFKSSEMYTKTRVTDEIELPQFLYCLCVWFGNGHISYPSKLSLLHSALSLLALQPICGVRLGLGQQRVWLPLCPPGFGSSRPHWDKVYTPPPLITCCSLTAPRFQKLYTFTYTTLDPLPLPALGPAVRLQAKAGLCWLCWFNKIKVSSVELRN